MTHDPAEFGDTWADAYDEVYAHLEQDGRDAATYLKRLREEGVLSGGTVLELGAGTGRIALPLAGAGFCVTALDASARILARLRAKPGGVDVRTVVADMQTPPLRGPFDVVLCAFNTLFSLPDQAAQVRCVAAAAALLPVGGIFVVEAAVPQPWRLDEQGHSLTDVRDDQVALDVADHDPVAQTIRSARVIISDSLGVRSLPLRLRYAWPSEIDLMARLAGLRLVARDGGWSGTPFDADATRHVSRYARLAVAT